MTSYRDESAALALRLLLARGELRPIDRQLCDAIAFNRKCKTCAHACGSHRERAPHACCIRDAAGVVCACTGFVREKED